MESQTFLITLAVALIGVYAAHLLMKDRESRLRRAEEFRKVATPVIELLNTEKNNLPRQASLQPDFTHIMAILTGKERERLKGYVEQYRKVSATPAVKRLETNDLIVLGGGTYLDPKPIELAIDDLLKVLKRR